MDLPTALEPLDLVIAAPAAHRLLWKASEGGLAFRADLPSGAVQVRSTGPGSHRLELLDSAGGQLDAYSSEDLPDPSVLTDLWHKARACAQGKRRRELLLAELRRLAGRG